MTVSHRARNAETFHALDFAQRAADLEAQGHHVVKLSIGSTTSVRRRPLLAAGRDALDGRPLPYTPPLGLPELRSALSDFYRDRHGVQVPAERIAITMGASAALLLATAATTDPGDEVILADPPIRATASSCSRSGAPSSRCPPRRRPATSSTPTWSSGRGATARPR